MSPEPFSLSQPKRNTILNAVKDYGRQLFGFIRGRVATDEDAEDILQDVWYQFSNVPEVEAIESVSGWLHRVARNRITDAFRKKKPELLDDIWPDDGDEDGPSFRDMLLSDATSPEDEYLRGIFWEELNAALDELPAAQRDVFVMNELEDLTLQEIADLKGEKLKTIISRKGYAVKHLRRRLQTLYQEFMNY